MGKSVGNLTNEIEIDRNVMLRFPEHEARVLETPLYIGNGELRLYGCRRTIDVNLHRDCQVVRIAEKREHTGHLNG